MRRIVLPVTIMLSVFSGAAIGAAGEAVSSIEPLAEKAPLPAAGMAISASWKWSWDIDGDGLADLANPTGHQVRGLDSYGSGVFHASRSNGRRRHRGVDFVAEPGEVVRAPIAGQVTNVGYAYRGDERFRFVEVTNATLGRTARVLYVGPDVVEGQVVMAGDPIGVSQNLAARYPAGMTNHVHVEMTDDSGVALDASELLPLGSADEGHA